MARLRPNGAALTIAAAFVLYCGFSCVEASIRPAKADNDDDATVILFSGRNIWRNGTFLYGGLLIAPGGFNQDGFMLKTFYSGGVYRYTSGLLGGATVVGAQFVGDIMPGWRIKRYGVEVKFFFGLDFERHRLWPDDPSSKLRGNALGERVAAEFWYEPTPMTMVAGDFSLTTIATQNSARLAYGWHVFDDLLGGFYVGPEIQYFGSDDYRQLRVGAHITGLKTDNYEWSSAIGWAKDSDARSSPYLRLNLTTRR